MSGVVSLLFGCVVLLELVCGELGCVLVCLCVCIIGWCLCILLFVVVWGVVFVVRASLCLFSFDFDLLYACV